MNWFASCWKVCVLTLYSLLISSLVQAHEGELEMTVWRVTSSGPTKEVGKIYFRDTRYGLIVAPRLQGLTPGLHGSHLHEFANCDAHKEGAGAGAGNHYDPDKTGKHAGPYEQGHLGDLPNLTVEADGSARIPVLAPRLKLADLHGRALIIHAGADLYDDSAPDLHSAHNADASARHPAHAHDVSPHATAASATGGERMYCGIVEKP